MSDEITPVTERYSPAGTGVVSRQATPAPIIDRLSGNRLPSFSRMKILSRMAGNSTAPVVTKSTLHVGRNNLLSRSWIALCTLVGSLFWKVSTWAVDLFLLVEYLPTDCLIFSSQTLLSLGTKTGLELIWPIYCNILTHNIPHILVSTTKFFWTSQQFKKLDG